MIRDKEAEEVVHIRQAWIKAINRVAEALAYRFRNDILQTGKYANMEVVGCNTVIESIIAFRALLVDYGEAPIRTEIDKWHDEHEDEFKGKNDYKRMFQYRRWFEFMVQTLNKYNMLFDTQPRGYSNVTMTSIHENGGGSQ